MANIKSAKKRILVNETKAARNKAIKSKVKTCVKKVETAVAKKDAAAAQDALKVAISEINKAGSKEFTTRTLAQERLHVYQSCKRNRLIYLNKINETKDIHYRHDGCLLIYFHVSQKSHWQQFLLKS